MTDHDWPGNVRELANEIQRMVTLCDEDRPLPPTLLSASVTGGPPASAAPTSGTLKDRVEAVERAAIEDALRRHAGNISRVADELGLSRVGLRAKIDRFQLSRACPDDK